MKDEIKKLLDELIEKPTSAFLATVDESGFPSIRAVFNLRNKERFAHPAKIIDEYEEDPYTVYISTNTSSVKMKHILNDSRIALYFSLPDEGKGIMLQGEAEVIEDMEFKKKLWMDNWTMYYPQGYDDPDFTMLKIKPKILRGWYRGKHEHKFSD